MTYTMNAREHEETSAGTKQRNLSLLQIDRHLWVALAVRRGWRWFTYHYLGTPLSNIRAIGVGPFLFILALPRRRP